MSGITYPDFRYSLRTLLLAVFVAATGAVWYGQRLRSEELQLKVAREIASKGGYVWNDSTESSVEVVFYPDPAKSCGQVRCIAGWSNPIVTFSDADLPLLSRLKDLKSVDFVCSQVSATAMRDFRRTHPDIVVKP